MGFDPWRKMQRGTVFAFHRRTLERPSRTPLETVRSGGHRPGPPTGRARAATASSLARTDPALARLYTGGHALGAIPIRHSRKPWTPPLHPGADTGLDGSPGQPERMVRFRGRRQRPRRLWRPPARLWRFRLLPGARSLPGLSPEDPVRIKQGDPTIRPGIVPPAGSPIPGGRRTNPVPPEESADSRMPHRNAWHLL